MNRVSRETFTTSKGFILAAVGSAVSMANIWLFPVRLVNHGGATFLIPYICFMFIVAISGMVSEIAFGRLVRGGPIKAFSRATEDRLDNPTVGKVLGIIPNISSLFLAIGYFIVLSWTLRYLLTALSGELLLNNNIFEFTNFFYNGGFYAEFTYLFFSIAIVLSILFFGVKDGIERINKIVVPLFFIIFIILGIYVFFLPNSREGYSFLFTIDFNLLKDPMLWVYALGQSFFSLSLTGAGLMVYGSFLKRSVSISKCVSYIAFFDILASLLVSLVLIPAMASVGQDIGSGGSGLLFIYIPLIFRKIPGGRLMLVLFFAAIFLVGLTTLINLVEVPISSIVNHLRQSRELATWSICTFILIVCMFIRDNVLVWIDLCSIYLVPLSAGISGIMFFWFLRKSLAMRAINHGSSFKYPDFFYYCSKFIYVGLDFLIMILGILYGTIG